MLSDIKNRKDVKEIIVSFYSSIQKDDLLGPVFNSVITDWESHYDHLTDFWESNLFLVSKYKGNPIKVHQQVDKESNHVIDQSYFVQWLKIWNKTIDGKFQGDKAQLMKNRARNMSSYIWIQIVQKR